MTGTLAQIVSLTSFGNEVLQSGILLNDYYPENSTLQFCNQVVFSEFHKKTLLSKSKNVLKAKNPNEWFQYLLSSKCRKIRLYYQPSRNQLQDHKMAGFVGGGGAWIIETIYKNDSNLWWNSWSVTDQNTKDKKTWSVKYVCDVHKSKIIDKQDDMDVIRTLLESSLMDIEEFAFRNDLENWGNVFSKARKILNSDEPEHDFYHKDIIVRKNYPLPVRQILFSAGSAWVFGGMGSWNDMVFNKTDDSQNYERLSASLYSAINQAILATVNSF
jgi:hypothetical protein